MNTYNRLIEMLGEVLDLSDHATYNYILDKLHNEHNETKYKNIIGILLRISDKVKHLSNIYNSYINARMSNIDLIKLNIKDNLIKPLIEYMLYDFKEEDFEAFIHGDPDIEMVIDDKIINTISRDDYVRVFNNDNVKDDLYHLLITITNELAIEYYEIYKQVWKTELKRYLTVIPILIFIPVKWINDDLYTIIVEPIKGVENEKRKHT